VKHDLVEYYAQFHKHLSALTTASESMEWVRILIATCKKNELRVGSAIDAQDFARIVSDTTLSNYEKRQQLFSKLLPEWQPRKAFFKPAEVGVIEQLNDLIPLIELVLERNPGLRTDLKVCL
jgi:hypothetical protein